MTNPNQEGGAKVKMNPGAMNFLRNQVQEEPSEPTQPSEPIQVQTQPEPSSEPQEPSEPTQTQEPKKSLRNVDFSGKLFDMLESEEGSESEDEPQEPEDYTKVDEPKDPKKIDSFRQLKQKFADKEKFYQDELDQLKSQIAKYENKDTLALREELTALATRNEELEEENHELSYYRKKVDLRSDPQVQSQYLKPMEELKIDINSILQDYETDINFDDLLQQSTVKGLNDLLTEAIPAFDGRHDVKSRLQKYRGLAKELSEIESQEQIDSTIKKHKAENAEAKIKRIQKTSERGFEKGLESLTTAKYPIRDYIKDESNKDQSLLDHKTVMRDAKKVYSDVVNFMGDNINDDMAHYLAQVSMLAAVAPKYLMQRDNIFADLTKKESELENLKKADSFALNQRATKKAQQTKSTKKAASMKDATKTITDLLFNQR